MAAFDVLKAELKAKHCLDLVQKALDTGALTPEKAKQAKDWLAPRAAADIQIAKAIPLGPTLPEIVKGGYFDSLPAAPFQRAIR
jgi:hypothetical protein